MGSTLGFQTKRELLLQMVSRYREASVSQKGALLDEIAATTGYARRYTMWLLNHPQEVQQPPRRRCIAPPKILSNGSQTFKEQWQEEVIHGLSPAQARQQGGQPGFLDCS